MEQTEAAAVVEPVTVPPTSPATPVEQPRSLEEEKANVDRGGDPADFATVFGAERAQIALRRANAGFDAASIGPRKDNLTGLGLSGGGIRSGTFCLGLLQGLHSLGLLRGFDYLSTVSGGGFVGGWWSAFVNRQPYVEVSTQQAQTLSGLLPDKLAIAPINGSRSRLVAIKLISSDDVRALRGSVGNKRPLLDAVERLCAAARLFPINEEIEPTRPKDDSALPPEPLHHLRLFANYLTPRKGAFSADTWRAAAVVSRNMGFTWLMLLPLLLCLIVAGRLPFLAQAWFNDQTISFTPDVVMPRSLPRPTALEPTMHPVLPDAQLVAGDSTASATVKIGQSSATATVSPASDALEKFKADRWRTALRERLGFALLPPGILFALVAFMSFYWLWTVMALPEGWDMRFLATGMLAFFVLIQILTVGAVIGFGWLDNKWACWIVPILIVLFACVARMTFLPTKGDASNLTTAEGAERLRNRIIRDHAQFLVQFVAVLAFTLLAGFGHDVAGFMLDYTNGKIASVGWGTVMVAVGGAIYTGLQNAPTGGGDRRSDAIFGIPSIVVFSVAPVLVLLVLSLVGAWVVHQALELICGRIHDPDTVLHPLLVLAAICVLATVAVSFQWWFFNKQGTVRLARRFVYGAVFAMVVAVLCVISIFGPDGFMLLAIHLAVIIAMLGIVVIVGMIADPNNVSLHAFYKARLTRAYLGASNPDRPRNRSVTMAAFGDDLVLSRIDNAKRGAPYQLINTTLNLVGGRDLSSAQRQACSFVFSQAFCGGLHTGYRPTNLYCGDSMTLGTAVAISGAAVAPNSGAHAQSGAMAMLLTLLNVRLGFWAPNPAKRMWTRVKPEMWPYYTLREFFSKTTDLSAYAYLTDGGHFDNTSLYSLVERGCRNIVVADCGADPELCFQDLGDAIRRCRIDFGAEIKIDLSPLKRGEKSKLSAAHIAVGTIRYDARHVASLWGATEAEAGEFVGRLILVKPSLTKSVPADVLQYATENDAFPQQTTADQWFGEAQFESYRRLGYHIAREAFGDLEALQPFAAEGPLTGGAVEALFAAVEARELARDRMTDPPLQIAWA